MKWAYRTEEIQTVLGPRGYDWVQRFENADEILRADTEANAEALNKGEEATHRSALGRNLDALLASLGEEGWEFVAFTHEVPDNRVGMSELLHCRAVFKRPVD